MKARQKWKVGFMIGMILCVSIGFIRITHHADAATGYQYLIKVNKQQNCVTIYEKDAEGAYTKPVKAMVCSTGSATPIGTYNTMTKYRWKILLDDVWGQYSTRITGSILFHSVWYYKQDPSTLSATQYNKLGTTCSHGCIRLTVEDAKWIYDNCPVGTTVVIYNDKVPGPLGKPTAQKLAAGTGWDPTDPDPKNPTYSITPAPVAVEKVTPPTIKGAKDQTIKWGSEFVALAGITATSYKGINLTKEVEVEGTVNTKVAGSYKITYRVKDNLKQEKTVSVTITVKPCPDKLKLKGVAKRYIQSSQVVDEAFCKKGVSLYIGKKKLSKSKLEVTIEPKKDGYKVTYSAAVAEVQPIQKTVSFLFDDEPPVLEVKHVLYSHMATVNRDFVLHYVKVRDNRSKLTKEDVKVKIAPVYNKGDLVTFTVSDEAGNQTSETVQFTRTSSVKILNVENHTVPAGTVIDKKLVMKKICGLDGDVDVTDKIKVKISDPEDDVYTVTYELSNKYDAYTKIISFFTVETEKMEE